MAVSAGQFSHPLGMSVEGKGVIQDDKYLKWQ
jgi:hypothetical protein